MYLLGSMETEESVDFSVVKVTGSGELLNVFAGTEIPVLWQEQ